jgi:hypothetical protein
MHALSQLPIRSQDPSSLAGQEQLVECIAEMAHPQHMPRQLACGFMR